MPSQIVIDEVDVIILKTLLTDARTSFSEMARKCSVSTNMIITRFNRLKKEGVIVGTNTAVSKELFGRKYLSIFEIVASAAQIKSLIPIIKKNPNVKLFHPQIGRYNFHIVAESTDLEEIKRTESYLRMQPGVKEVTTSMAVEQAEIHLENIDLYPTNQNAKSLKLQQQTCESTSQQPNIRRKSDYIPKVDDVDRKIIDALFEDVRAPFNKIAKKLGTSTQTIINRYEALKQNGIIRNCSIIVDINKIGYDGIAVLLIKKITLEQDSYELLQIPDVFIIMRTIGDYDVHAIIAFRTSKDLYEKIQKIQELDNVDRVEFSYVVPALDVPSPWHSTK